MKTLTQEEKTAKRKARERAKDVAKIEEERNQTPVKRILITIEWKKSRMWGSNPHAEAKVEYYNDRFERRGGYTASGCGYDKESTVVADIFNDFLKYKLWAKSIDECSREHAPYGIMAGEYDEIGYRGFSGGIGVSCYRDISRFIGGEFKSITHGKTFDVYEYIDGAVLS